MLFAYDAFGRRILKTAADGSGVTRTLTLGGLYERRERIEGGVSAVRHVYHVHGDQDAVAQFVYDEATQDETAAYLARDGLGSVSVVFDKDGAELERFFHEPFGRRVGAGGKPLPSFAPVSEVSLGFTGHRHDDDLGLIDMKGRVYDPVQRRFLTPDPLVSNPFDSQAYNRYAYVRGNPLRFTDPSGFQAAPLPPDGTPHTPENCTGCVFMPPARIQGAPPAPPVLPPAVPSSDGRGQAPSSGANIAPAPPPNGGEIGPPLPPRWEETGETGEVIGPPMVLPVRSDQRPAVTLADAGRAWAPATFRAIGPPQVNTGLPAGVAMLQRGFDQQVAEGGAQSGRLIVEIGNAGIQLQMLAGEAALAATLTAALGGAAAAGRAKIALDTNALIAAVERGQANAILQGRAPIIPITAVKEFLRGGGSSAALREFLAMNGGRIGRGGAEHVAVGLQVRAGAMGRSLGLGDARVAAGAIEEGVPLVTFDKQLKNFLRAFGWTVEP